MPHYRAAAPSWGTVVGGRSAGLDGIDLCEQATGDCIVGRLAQCTLRHGLRPLELAVGEQREAEVGLQSGVVGSDSCGRFRDRDGIDCFADTDTLDHELTRNIGLSRVYRIRSRE